MACRVVPLTAARNVVATRALPLQDAIQRYWNCGLCTGDSQHSRATTERTLDRSRTCKPVSNESRGVTLL